MNDYKRERVWPIKIIAFRYLWSFFSLIFFRFTPIFFWSLRNSMLKLFGAKIGKGVRVSNRAKIFFPWNIRIGNGSSIGDNAIIYPLGSITIGNYVTISQYSHICAGSHNISLKKLPLMKTNIFIDDYAWCCANTFIGPNANIGKKCIITPGSVFKGESIEIGIYTGNPAVLSSFRKLNEN